MIFQVPAIEAISQRRKNIMREVGMWEELGLVSELWNLIYLGKG